MIIIQGLWKFSPLVTNTLWSIAPDYITRAGTGDKNQADISFEKNSRKAPKYPSEIPKPVIF